MNILRLILIILCLTVSNIIAQIWTLKSKADYPSFNKIHFVSEKEGWIVGEFGSIYKTSNYGQDWIEQVSGTEKHLYSVFFIDELRGFAGGDYRSILSTIDGGNTWEYDSLLVLSEKATIRCISFIDSENGWILASVSNKPPTKSWVLNTTDGGGTWDTVLYSEKELLNLNIKNNRHGVVCGKDLESFYYTIDGITWNNSNKAIIIDSSYTRTRYDIRSVQLVNDSIGYAVGFGHFITQQPSLLFKTIDGGINWVETVQLESNKTFDFLYSLSFNDENNGIAVGGIAKGSIVLRTTDGGINWIPVETPFGSTINDVYFANNKSWVVGKQGIIGSSENGNIWQLNTPIPNANINSINFPNSNIGFAGGFDGVLLKTINGGDSWTGSYLIANGVSLTINKIQFINPDIGFAAHIERMVTKTTDGGESWQKILPDTNVVTYSNSGLFFVSENLGFVVGKDGSKSGIIYKTTDGGNSWQIKPNIINANLNDVAFFSNHRGIAVGNSLSILFTLDSGENWTVSKLDTSSFPDETFENNTLPSLLKVAYLNDSTAVAVGTGMIIKTTNSGATWWYVQNDLEATMSGISFENDTLGYICGGGESWKTSDAGETWNSLLDSSITDVDFKSLAISKSGNIFFGARNSYIYKFEDVITGVNDKPIIASNLKLAQNYPNPFNPSTWIEFEIPEREHVKLTIYDVLGQQIQVLTNDVFNRGTYKINFNASSLSSGIYFYTIQYKNKMISKKMQLLK